MNSLGKGITKMISQDMGSNLNIILGLMTLSLARDTSRLKYDTKTHLAMCQSHQTWQYAMTCDCVRPGTRFTVALKVHRYSTVGGGRSL
jgi:hypothetical protein